MDVYNKNEAMLSILSLTQKKIDEAYAMGKKEAQDEIDVMSVGLVKAHDAFIKGDMDEVYHQIYTLMVAHDVQWWI